MRARVRSFLTLLVVGLVSWACATSTEPRSSPTLVVAYRDTVIAHDLLCSGYSVASGQCRRALQFSAHLVSAITTPTYDVQASTIFAGNPKRPGEGHVTWGGIDWRIEGTSAAGVCDYCGRPTYPLPLGTWLILDDGKGHDLVHGPILDQAHLTDLYVWDNAFHGKDSP